MQQSWYFHTQIRTSDILPHLNYSLLTFCSAFERGVIVMLLLPLLFGLTSAIPVDNFIVEGEDVDIADFPWQVCAFHCLVTNICKRF